jgi:hypothetical protein
MLSVKRENITFYAFHFTLLFLFDLDDLGATVGATGWAYMVWSRRRTALGAAH